MQEVENEAVVGAPIHLEEQYPAAYSVCYPEPHNRDKKWKCAVIWRQLYGVLDIR
jgi:hypothetical protein